MPYPPALVAPMREEMISMGARELATVAEVDAAFRRRRRQSRRRSSSSLLASYTLNRNSTTSPSAIR